MSGFELKLQAALAHVDARLHLIPAGSGAGDGIAGEVALILDIILAERPKSVAMTDEPLLAELGMVQALRDKGVEVIEPPSVEAPASEVDAWMNALATADTGLTSALGIAEETGTMLLAPRVPDQRAVSLLPVRHVAILRAEQIVPDVAALMKLWQEAGETDGSAVFVTGPSRTADIEKELVLGVHGPQAVDVVLLA